ncbi:hypothetical protein E2I00_007183 [Balaenoptera physalus]|uniref:Glyceraldehyde-3-phosphate dehydrogenase n=1 Tax=Balaenoptera physalus TaxID=9770 RepID=A0A643BRQ0_BALPH|nr:hypothetical protein E2I00_007183 [Balaenoptera physalus]
MVKAIVNGFGCTGHLVTRVAFNYGKVSITIDDCFTDYNYKVYTFWCDSTHGKFNGTVQSEKGKLVISGKPTSIFQEQYPANIKWGAAGAEYVLESTGVLTTLEKTGPHMKCRAKRLIISVPSADSPMFVMGMNHKKYNSLKMVSNASCTTTCLAPLANVTVDRLMTTVHTVTDIQKTIDGLTGKLYSDG